MSSSSSHQLSAAATPSSRLQTRDYSCLACKNRKARCDRQDPCSRCTENGLECVPGVRATYRRRSRQLPQTGQTTPETPPKPSRELDNESKPHGEVPRFGHNLWNGIADELSNPLTGKEEPEDEAQTHTVADSPLSDLPDLLFARSPRNVNWKDLAPTPTNAFTLWQTFVQNVNPLSKIIHVPSVQPEIIEAIRDLDSLKRSSLALVFAIYAAAVMSMKDEDCRATMGESKRDLWTRYISATEQALAAAGFLRIANFTVLQAYTLYLLTTRELYDSQTLWLLTGFAVRMAQRLGLHTSKPQPSIFDTEMRRRLWWQILLIDGRAAQLAGVQELAMMSVHFPLPRNWNDADISPGMTERPAPRAEATELIFCLLRYELGLFLQQNNYKLHNTSAPEHKDRLIDEFERNQECKYLRYCDPAIPLHLLAAAGTRSAICKMRLTAHHPKQYKKGASIPQSERDILFALSLKMVEYDVLGQSTEVVSHFAWHMDAFFQLDALVFMLIESRHHPPGPTVDKAWQLVTDVYRYRAALVDNESNATHAKVARIVLAAWEERELNLAKHHLDPVPVPPIITKLRTRLAPKAALAGTSASNSCSPGTQQYHHMTAGGSGSATESYDDSGPASQFIYTPGIAADDPTAAFPTTDWDYWLSQRWDGSDPAQY